MSGLRPQGVARSPPGAGAGRAWRRRQAGHDQRRLSLGVVARHGRALPQAREPAHRRAVAARADRRRPAHEHQLLRHAQFLRPSRDGRRAQGGTERRQLRQGRHGRAGRSQRADGGDRAVFRDLPGRRDQGAAEVHGFRAGRRHFAERRAALQRRAGPRTSPPASGAGEAPAMAPFDRSAEIEWSPVWSLRDQRFRYLPTSLLYFFYRGPGPTRCTPIRTVARPATHWKKPSSRAFSSWWSAMPMRSGGTIDRSGRGRPRPVRRSLYP